MIASLLPKHSLFSEEWSAQFGAELKRMLTHWISNGLCPEQIEQCSSAFYAAHPPCFSGVYCSPTIDSGETLADVPPLIAGESLWIDTWHRQPPRQVHQVIPIPYHRLVALVTDTELLILRADELVQATTTPAEDTVGQARG